MLSMVIHAMVNHPRRNACAISGARAACGRAVAGVPAQLSAIRRTSDKAARACVGSVAG